jgi:hypothetical protein
MAMMRSTGVKFPKPDAVLLGAISMSRNQSAIERVSWELALHPAAATGLLAGLRSAAREIAFARGMLRLVEIADRE